MGMARCTGSEGGAHLWVKDVSKTMARSCAHDRFSPATLAIEHMKGKRGG